MMVKECNIGNLLSNSSGNGINSCECGCKRIEGRRKRGETGNFSQPGL